MVEALHQRRDSVREDICLRRHLSDRRVRAGDPLEPVGPAAACADVEDHPHFARILRSSGMAREIDAGRARGGRRRAARGRAHRVRSAPPGGFPTTPPTSPSTSSANEPASWTGDRTIVFYCRRRGPLGSGRRCLQRGGIRRGQPGRRDRGLAGGWPRRRGRSRPSQRAPTALIPATCRDSKYLNPDRDSFVRLFPMEPTTSVGPTPKGRGLARQSKVYQNVPGTSSRSSSASSTTSTPRPEGFLEGERRRTSSSASA